MKKRGIGMLLPLWVWTLLFVVFPMGYILLLSFVSGDAFGIRYVFTLDNYRRLLSADLLACVVRTLKMSGLTTLFALLAGYPFAYFMARAKKRWRTTLLLLIVIPFWTSALMRMFGWRIFFESNGVFNGVLKWFHDLWYGFLRLFGGYADGMPRYRPVKLLYTRGLVLFGMVYTMLPFMVLPIYSSVEKQDVSLREASRDLGANPFVSFLTVSLPLSLPGAISGCVLVFVPVDGSVLREPDSGRRQGELSGRPDRLLHQGRTRLGAERGHVHHDSRPHLPVHGNLPPLLRRGRNGGVLR